MTWNRIALGKICRIKHGFAFKGEHFSNKGQYVLLTPGNFQETGGLKLKGDKEKYYMAGFPPEYLLSQNDMLVVLTDLIQTAPILGGAAYIPSDNIYLHNQRLGKVTDLDKEMVHEKFLYYTFNSPNFRHHVRASATGSTVRHTAPDRMYSYEVNLPPLYLQKSIADILSAYDDLIENNLRRIQLLEEAARCGYKLLMEEAKITPKRLGDEATLIMGQSPPSSTYNDKGEGLPFHQGVTNYGFRFVENEAYCSSPARVAQADDILLSVRAPVGRLNFATEKICIGRGLSAVRHKHGYQQFQYQQLKDFFYIEDRIGNGSTFNATTKKELETLELPYPDKEAIAHFEKWAVPLHRMMVNLTFQNKRLREARDILLPRLMSGEIDVSSVAILTTEVLETV